MTMLTGEQQCGHSHTSSGDTCTNAHEQCNRTHGHQKTTRCLPIHRSLSCALRCHNATSQVWCSWSRNHPRLFSYHSLLGGEGGLMAWSWFRGVNLSPYPRCSRSGYIPGLGQGNQVAMGYLHVRHVRMYPIFNCVMCSWVWAFRICQGTARSCSLEANTSVYCWFGQESPHHQFWGYPSVNFLYEAVLALESAQPHDPTWPQIMT